MINAEPIVAAELFRVTCPLSVELDDELHRLFAKDPNANPAPHEPLPPHPEINNRTAKNKITFLFMTLDYLANASTSIVLCLQQECLTTIDRNSCKRRYP